MQLKENKHCKINVNFSSLKSLQVWEQGPGLADWAWKGPSPSVLSQAAALARGFPPSCVVGTWPCSSTATSDELLQYSVSGLVLIKLKDYDAPNIQVTKSLLVKHTKCTGFLFYEEVALGEICHSVSEAMIHIMVSTELSNLIRPRLENIFFLSFGFFFFFKSH